MTIEKLNEQAKAIAETLPEARGEWLIWNATLATILVDLLAAQREQTASLSSLRSELTIIVHSAIREYSAGVDMERAAVLEEIAGLKQSATQAASDRRVILSLLGSIAEHLEAAGDSAGRDVASGEG